MAMEIIKSKYNGQFLFLKCTGDFDLEEAKEIIEKQDKYFEDGDIRDYIVTSRLNKEIKEVLGEPLLKVRKLYMFGDLETHAGDSSKLGFKDKVFETIAKRDYISWYKVSRAKEIADKELTELKKYTDKMCISDKLVKLYITPIIHRGQIYYAKYEDRYLIFKRLREIDGMEYLVEAINVNGKTIPIKDCLGLPKYRNKKN